LETSRDPDVRREKQSSYPDEFMAQLRWLRDHYVDVTTQSQNPRYKPRESRFPLLYYTHFQTILTLVSEKSITGVFQNMRETEPNHLDWAQFFYYLHPEQMAAIFSNGENWSECFKSAVQVIAIMEKLQFNPQILNQFCAGIVNQWPIIISSKYFDRSNAIKILSLLPDDQKRVFCESMKNRWGDFIYDHETHMEISGLLNPELMKYVMECVESYRPAPVAVEAKDEDSSLLRILRVYIEDRKKQPPTSRMNLFVWSDQDKIEAANALMKSFNNLIPLDKKYIKPLCDGKLKNQLEIHLAKYRPGVTLEQFLEERTKIKPVPPAPRLRRNSPDSK
jgi:hypothetical protein